MGANPSTTAPTGATGPGTVLGGRFQVEAEARRDALGRVLRARDQKSGRPVALRLVDARWLAGDGAFERLKAACRQAVNLRHPNVQSIYGIGRDPGTGVVFVAYEWVDGTPLDQYLARRKAEGTPISLRGAFNLVSAICKALDHAHPVTCHGGLRPAAVWVRQEGHVEVADFGVTRALLELHGPALLPPEEQASLAPEVKAGGAPTPASDIFGLGAILYALLTQKSPAEGFVPPSQVHPEANEHIDHLLLRCLAADPAGRFETAGEVRRAFLAQMGGAAEPEAGADGLDIEVDVDLDTVPPPTVRPPAEAPTAAPALNAPAVPPAPRVPFEAASAPTPAGPAESGAVVDLSKVLERITENDAPRWMVVKDGLDHGPFSGRELVDLILKGEVLRDHVLLNMDTGERRPLHTWDDFLEFAEQYELKRKQQEEQAALQRSERVEKRSTLFKAMVALVLLAVLGGAVGVYLVSRGAEQDEEQLAADGDLFERGNVEIEGGADILKRKRRRGRRRGGRGGAGGAGLSYEEAMNRGVELDVAGGGGEQQLSAATVTAVMNRHINSFFSCVGPELRRGGRLSKVQIDLAIAGDGRVLGASVRQGSPEFRRCVASKVRRIRFPKFSAPRMATRFSFMVD